MMIYNFNLLLCKGRNSISSYNYANTTDSVFLVLLDDKTVTFSKVKKNKIWVGFCLGISDNSEHFSQKELQV